MKTVADIAAETSVNVQTVYRRLNKLSQKSNEVLTEKIDGITYFTEIGEKLLIESLTPDKPVKQPESAEIAFLREQVRQLQADLREEREHNRNITEQLARIAENAQKLHGVDMITDGSAPVPEKVSLWSKLFRRGGCGGGQK